MRPLLACAMLALAAAMLTGCGGIHGAWKLDSVEPADSPRHYAFSTITLNDDGTYVACAEASDKKVETYKGRFEQDEDAGKLTFSVGEQKSRTYGYKLDGSRLSLTSEMKDGKSMTARYTRLEGSCCVMCGCTTDMCKCEKCPDCKMAGGACRCPKKG